MDWIIATIESALDPTAWSGFLTALTGTPWFMVVAIAAPTLLLVYVILNSEAAKVFFSRKKSE